MPIIVEGNPATAELLTSAVTKARTRTVPHLEELKRLLTGEEDEYAVILGPSVDLEAAAALADTLRVTRPATSVLLIRRRVDTSVLAEALRSGMREVIEERDLTGLTAAVTRASQVWEAIYGTSAGGEAQNGKLITVFSPKGGVGKTTVAVNLAIALADGGKNRVCLLDLDLGFGDVAITLQLFPSQTIANAVPVAADLDQGTLETLLTSHRDGVSLLAAPLQPDAKESISPALISKIVQLLKSSFDYVVVDTAPSFDEQVLQAFDLTDECVLVTTLDVPTLKNVKIAVETLDLLNVAPDRRTLVLNRADEAVGLTRDKVESILGMKVGVTIPAAVQVAGTTNSGHPIVLAMPRHEVSQSITALARSLARGELVETADGDLVGAGSAKRRGFLRSRR